MLYRIAKRGGVQEERNSINLEERKKRNENGKVGAVFVLAIRSGSRWFDWQKGNVMCGRIERITILSTVKLRVRCLGTSETNTAAAKGIPKATNFVISK